MSQVACRGSQVAGRRSQARTEQQREQESRTVGANKPFPPGRWETAPGSKKRARGRSIPFRCRKNARGVINFEHIPVRDQKNARGVEVFRFVVEKTREGSSILKLFRSEVEKAREGSKYPVLVSKKRARGCLFWNYSGPRSKNARGVEVSRPGVEKTRKGWSILKLFRSEVEKTSEGSKVTVPLSKKRASGHQF